MFLRFSSFIWKPVCVYVLATYPAVWLCHSSASCVHSPTLLHSIFYQTGINGKTIIFMHFINKTRLHLFFIYFYWFSRVLCLGFVLQVMAVMTVAFQCCPSTLILSPLLSSTPSAFLPHPLLSLSVGGALSAKNKINVFFNYLPFSVRCIVAIQVQYQFICCAE